MTAPAWARGMILAGAALALAPAALAELRPLPAERPVEPAPEERPADLASPPPEPAPEERPADLAAPPAEPAPMPREVGVVAEPDGYRGDPYKAPVPATLRGAMTIDDATAHALWWSGRVPFVDVMPVPVRPPDLPEGTIWRDPPRQSIQGATWLANMGYQGLDPASLDEFLAGLAFVSKGDKAAPLVFFCMSNCWMSWNAGKRAMEHGYTHVFWYPGGADGWAAEGWPLETVKPWKPTPG